MDVPDILYLHFYKCFINDKTIYIIVILSGIRKRYTSEYLLSIELNLIKY